MKWMVFIAALLTSLELSAQPSPTIFINQLGYYPNAPKIAVCLDQPGVSKFYVVRDKDTVYRGQLSAPIKSAYSSIETRTADFSSLKQPGTYRLYVSGLGVSYPVRIDSNIHRQLSTSSIKAYYYHRVSEPLPERHAGKWFRAAGHPDTAVLIHASAASGRRPAGTLVRSPGGWYDAGDYNKYIVNSGITMATLLGAYEDFPEYFDKLSLNIPESSDQVPDLLNEILYNLRWMLTMQDPADGGVYHKCTNANFDGMVMPGVTKAPRFLVQKSTAAALDFAAVMAQAGRVFKNHSSSFPGLPDSCIRAAQKAWDWAKANPSLLYRQDELNKQFQPAITTGAYGDGNLSDEWFWAGAELYRTLEDSAYLPELKQVSEVSVPTWNSVLTLGVYSLLRESSLDWESKNVLQSKLLQRADTLISNTTRSAFQTVMGQSAKDFVWGSNSVAANQSNLLIMAYLLTKNKKYLQYALTNLDYILGRNATGYCFVTGWGSRSPRHPHQRPSEADGIEDPIPGWMVGGPNPGMQDKCSYPYSDPERAYTDHVCSYASNEVAINWNAPIVYLAAAVEYLQLEF